MIKYEWVHLNSPAVKKRIRESELKRWWVAEYSGIHKSTLRRWLLQESPKISADRAIALANTLEVTMEKICEFKGT